MEVMSDTMKIFQKIAMEFNDEKAGRRPASVKFIDEKARTAVIPRSQLLVFISDG